MNILEQPETAKNIDQADIREKVGGVYDRDIKTSTNDITPIDKTMDTSETCKTTNGEKSCSGSKENYGKFQSSEDLLNAYKNLEAEFTKKCQALNAIKECDNPDRPQSLSTNANALDRFIADHPQANNYAQQLSEIISDTPAEDILQTLTSKYVALVENDLNTPEDMVSNQDFVERYVYNNSNICDEVVRRYVGQIHRDNAPKLVMTSSASHTAISRRRTPNSIAEAGEMAKNIIKKI